MSGMFCKFAFATIRVDTLQHMHIWALANSTLCDRKEGVLEMHPRPKGMVHEEESLTMGAIKVNRNTVDGIKNTCCILMAGLAHLYVLVLLESPRVIIHT